MSAEFSAEGSALQRYASVLNCTEINSSFYRSHKRETYARWSEAVPADFRFSVKLPKAITHDNHLIDVSQLVEKFADEVAMLGKKLGALLVQLPPSLRFEGETAEKFCGLCRTTWSVPIVCEPRHHTWYEPDALALLQETKIALVAASPVRIPGADDPVPNGSLPYWRLHGSPKVYYSAYSDPELASIKEKMNHAGPGDPSCIFDNTASGAALKNALDLQLLSTASH